MALTGSMVALRLFFESLLTFRPRGKMKSHVVGPIWAYGPPKEAIRCSKIKIVQGPSIEPGGIRTTMLKLFRGWKSGIPLHSPYPSQIKSALSSGSFRTRKFCRREVLEENVIDAEMLKRIDFFRTLASTLSWVCGVGIKENWECPAPLLIRIPLPRHMPICHRQWRTLLMFVIQP